MIVAPANTWAACSAMNVVTATAPDAVRWTPSDPTQDGWLALYVAQSAICR